MRKAIVIVCALSLAACLSGNHPELYPLPGDYAYAVPKQTADGLPVGPIPDTLFDAAHMVKLREFFTLLKQGAFGEIHGVLLAYDGRLVLEEYFPGYKFHGSLTNFTADTPHHLASVTKSLTSLCAGIAIDKGFIKSVDQSFLDFYQDEVVPDRAAKAGITLRHLLTMTAGLEWDETTFPYTDPRNDVVRLYRSPDPLAFCLERKPVAAPGERWVYSGAYPNLLGDIVRSASGKSLDRFAQEYLYEPLGITRASWVTLNKGFIYASGDAELRPRDMMKIGLMVANRGLWNGKRIVSERWLEESMRPAARADAVTHYGFLWWLPELPAAAAQAMGPVSMANGWGCQHIVIAPERKLVLVLTGGNYALDIRTVPILSYLVKELFGS